MNLVLKLAFVSGFLLSITHVGHSQLLLELRTTRLRIPVPFRGKIPNTSPIHLSPNHPNSIIPTLNETLPNNSNSTDTHLSAVRRHHRGRAMMRGRSFNNNNNNANATSIQPNNANDTSLNNSTNSTLAATHNYTIEDYEYEDNTVPPQVEEDAQVSVRGKYVSEPGSTGAQHGDKCSPTGALEWDFCENAAYPNKGRMVCATKDLDPDNEGKCICKFAKIKEKLWVQMRYDHTKKMCLSPAGGVCYIKFVSKIVDGIPIYNKNITKAHEQCDDPVSNLESKKRVLLCSQAHPRRFSSFNPYHFYCLRKEDRLPGVVHADHIHKEHKR